MSSILIRSIQLLLSISILVIVHELGHFIIAQVFKVRVERFFLFFDPWFSILKKKIGHTIYGIGWLPLGGYVKISGMMMDDKNVLSESEKKTKNWEFRSKSAIKRLLIISGGIIFNILLSVFIFTFLLFKYGETSLPTKNVKYGIEVDSLGEKIGLKNGDKILFVNEKYVPYFNDIPKEILLGNSITVDRMGNIIKLSLSNSKKKFLFDRKKLNFFIKPRVPPIINYVIKNSEAEKYGLKNNDEILAINSEFVLFSDQLKDLLSKYKNENILISINRNGKFIQKEIFLDSKGILGIYLKNFMDLDQIFFFEKKNYSFFESIPYGIKKAWDVLKNQIFFLKNVFHIETKAYKQIGSFFSIAKEFPSKWNWDIFWTLTATLSIWLAFLNLFPIPSLDGGYILFIMIEMITRKKINEEIIERCTIYGFVIMSLIMMFIITWDIFKVFL
ncbi:RIP metalloprotease RseP [Blattabacterium sp. (Blaberus giganteus)]|uniref:RIP metalloprotease RseP n=1 Tax=Blattabacterium sp. (Blaberus giganteus) TaxID=1186051 RepID=UPI00025F6FF8|nr:RIP metalloprotease RseP [Blattabacterium sp. (Blaberus giganteus)]AFJ90926.1 M50 family membrane-associated zinc metalloprotease precursor [Blattabacterium sp. (Blaberus giganteus)]